jgi:hypothetical protein
LNSDAETIESGERLKDDNCLTSTRSENRKPICAIARDGSPQPARQLAVAGAALAIAGAVLAVAAETLC